MGISDLTRPAKDLELFSIEIFLFVFGVGHDQEDRVLGADVVVDNTSATALAPDLLQAGAICGDRDHLESVRLRPDGERGTLRAPECPPPKRCQLNVPFKGGQAD